MTQNQYLITRKLNILELGNKLGNVSEACRRLGVSRQHFYDIKAAIEEKGIEGLVEQARNKPRYANRVADIVEQKILEYSLEFPTQGQVRVSNELRKQHGLEVSPGGVRGVWMRHQLTTKALRLKRLEKWAAEHGKVLTESQVQALELAKLEKEAHGEIETFHPGFLLGQRHAVRRHDQRGGSDLPADRHRHVQQRGLRQGLFGKDGAACGRLSQRQGPAVLRQPLDAAAADAHGSGQRVLRRTGKSPLPAVPVPQRHRALADQGQAPADQWGHGAAQPDYPGGVLRVAFRKKLYTSLEQIQTDLDEYMAYYNERRTNQGKRCEGRTPMETFTEGVELYWQYVHEAMDRKPTESPTSLPASSNSTDGNTPLDLDKKPA